MAGTKLSERARTAGSDQTDRLPETPLFQVQPSGCPFMIQSSIGLPCLSAARMPSARVVSQGMVSNARSSRSGRMCLSHPSTVCALASDVMKVGSVGTSGSCAKLGAETSSVQATVSLIMVGMLPWRGSQFVGTSRMILSGRFRAT